MALERIGVVVDHAFVGLPFAAGHRDGASREGASLPPPPTGLPPTRRALLAAPLAAVLPACAGTQPRVLDCALDLGGLPAWVVAISWHTDIALPLDALEGPVLGALAARLPGARSVMFGFGKRSFITSPEPSVAEWLRGPLPGPAAIQVTGLRLPPPEALPGREVVDLPIAPARRARLAGFIAHAFADGALRQVRAEAIAGSIFFEARETYTLANNCNAWTARALGAADLPFTDAGVLWPEAVMRQARALTSGCAA